MNQVLTGKFITDERKKKGYTQSQLADKLSISNRTVSKWETGNGFPDVSLLLPLCDELEVSVNELFSGERIISSMLTISIFVVVLTGSILAKFFTSAEAYAAIGILFLVALICIVSVWIATTISLRNR